MMRELDTVSPVVWPSWCYAGEGQTDSETAAGTPEGSKDATGAVTTAKARGKRRAQNLMTHRYQRDVNGSAKDVKETREPEVKREASVKTERLSPGTVTTGENSSSSRSGTPGSSYPGTPPGGQSTTASTPETSHLKQMEQMMMSRNYSDFMRSLAAKYNNANPNDYFSASRNGFSQSLDPRFPNYKAGATPFVGLMAPLSASAVSPSSQTGTPTDPPKHTANSSSSLSLFPSNLFPPMIDMSSTQALLSMVRTASAHNQAALENYLKGATSHTKRGDTTPLDLSSAAPAKRQKTDLGFLNVLRTKDKPSKPRSVSPSGARKTAPVQGRCPSLCADTERQSFAHWTVDDVCSFVRSIDICAEYEKNFRDERIDGTSLPLLTEEHLTNSLSMKLGPALKLRATVARRLGHCTVCLHCVHCHGASSLGPAASPTSATAALTARPSSTGN